MFQTAAEWETSAKRQKTVFRNRSVFDKFISSSAIFPASGSASALFFWAPPPSIYSLHHSSASSGFLAVVAVAVVVECFFRKLSYSTIRCARHYETTGRLLDQISVVHADTLKVAKGSLRKHWTVEWARFWVLYQPAKSAIRAHSSVAGSPTRFSFTYPVARYWFLAPEWLASWRPTSNSN